MVREGMKAFPSLSFLNSCTKEKEMASERKKMALQLMKESVFDFGSTCAMCTMTKPGCGPRMTSWMQWETCDRWFHQQCLGMDACTFVQAKKETWNCLLCT